MEFESSNAASPDCSRADSKKPPPVNLESTQGGANWVIMSLTVSTPVKCWSSSTRKLKLLLVSAKFFMACLRVSFPVVDRPVHSWKDAVSQTEDPC